MKIISLVNLEEIIDLHKVQELMSLTNDNLMRQLIEQSEWESAIQKYLARQSKKDEWNSYKAISNFIPDDLRLQMFLRCFYTQQDAVSEEQYQYFSELCKGESIQSANLRKYLIHTYDFKFPNDYIKLYRGEHGLSTTEIGYKHTKSMDVQHGISWTYEPSVAGFFAVRTQSDDCRIYSANVHKNDILLIYDSRTEAEVIIKPMCLGTKLMNLREKRIEPNITVMRKYYKYRDEENAKFQYESGEYIK